MAQGDLYRISLFCSFRNQVSVNVLHYEQVDSVPAGIPNVDRLTAIAAAVANDIAPSLIDCLSQEARYEGCTVRYLDDLPALDLEVSSDLGANPGLAAAPGTMPSQVCGLIRKRALGATRRHRGRFYVPFPPAAAFDPNDLVAAAYATVMTDLSLRIGEPLDYAVGAEEFELVPVIMNGARPFAPKRIIATSVAAGFATQRRRGFFGRPNIIPF